MTGRESVGTAAGRSSRRPDLSLDKHLKVDGRWGRASQNDHHGTQNGVQFGSHDGGHLDGFRAAVSININIGVGDGFD